MSLHKILPALIIASTLVPALNAADDEGENSDFRLELILLNKEADWDATADSGLGSVNLSGDADLDRAFRIGLSSISHFRGVEGGPIGLVGGGAINYTHLEFDDNDVSERYQALSAQIRIGLGLYLGDIVHIEATPFAGIGASRGNIEGSESDVGLYWEYGICGGAFVSLGGAMQVGLIAGWLHGEYDLDFDENDNFPSPVDDVSVDLIHEGTYIGLSIGSRW